MWEAKTKDLSKVTQQQLAMTRCQESCYSIWWGVFCLTLCIRDTESLFAKVVSMACYLTSRWW